MLLMQDAGVLTRAPQEASVSDVERTVDRNNSANRLLMCGGPGVRSAHHESSAHWPGLMSMCVPWS